MRIDLLKPYSYILTRGKWIENDNVTIEYSAYDLHQFLYIIWLRDHLVDELKVGVP